MKNVSMASPWAIYAKMVEALFSGDKDVKVIFSEDDYKLSLYVTGLMGKKAEAIRALLPSEVPMGNITLTIDVIPGDEDDEPTYDELVKAAFCGNDNFAGIESQSHGMFGDTSYGLFKNKTAQFYIDDLSQYSGMDTVVYADLARELLVPGNGFYFSTEV